MNKRTLGILLMIPASLFVILICGIGLYSMIVDEPFATLVIFVFCIMIIAFIKGIELVGDA